MGALLCPFKEGLCVFLWAAGGGLFELFFWRVHASVCVDSVHVRPQACESKARVLRLKICCMMEKTTTKLSFHCCVIYGNRSGYSHKVRIRAINYFCTYVSKNSLVRDRESKRATQTHTHIEWKSKSERDECYKATSCVLVLSYQTRV